MVGEKGGELFVVGGLSEISLWLDKINYLKELLNMKKKGINAFDVHSRLLKL